MPRETTPEFHHLRIATWNCARGPFARKRAALDAYEPDVVVMTEAARPVDDESAVWFAKHAVGVAAYARSPYRVRELRRSRRVPCVYPVAIEGPVSFTLFGVWTWPEPTYKRAFANGLDAHRGLLSAYHRDRSFGREPDPTHYFLWKQDRPFHLDYCFVPRTWIVDEVTVGSFEEWARLSDHRPVIVDVRVPCARSAS